MKQLIVFCVKKKKKQRRAGLLCKLFYLTWVVDSILWLLHFTPTVVASLKILKSLILKQLLPLPAPFHHFRFRVRFRFQPLSSKRFRFHKKLTAFSFRFHIPDLIFHYTRCITPKRATSLRSPSPRHCACGQRSSFRRNVAAVASRWHNCVQFDRPEIWTPDLPHQRRTRNRSTNWPVRQPIKLWLSYLSTV